MMENSFESHAGPEISREAGTISAKCKDAGISHLTIGVRLELEKIREQVQNIE